MCDTFGDLPSMVTQFGIEFSIQCGTKAYFALYNDNEQFLQSPRDGIGCPYRFISEWCALFDVGDSSIMRAAKRKNEQFSHLSS